ADDDEEEPAAVGPEESPSPQWESAAPAETRPADDAARCDACLTEILGCGPDAEMVPFILPAPTSCLPPAVAAPARPPARAMPTNEAGRPEEAASDEGPGAIGPDPAEIGDRAPIEPESAPALAPANATNEASRPSPVAGRPVRALPVTVLALVVLLFA